MAVLLRCTCALAIALRLGSAGTAPAGVTLPGLPPLQQVTPPLPGVFISREDKRWLANLTQTIVAAGRIPTTFRNQSLLLFSPDDCTLYPNGSVVWPADCAWDPRDGCKRGTLCYADSYTRDSTYGITFAPEFYERDAVRAAADVFLNTSVPWGAHRGSAFPCKADCGLKVVEAILPLGSLSFGCPDNNAFLLKLAAFYATHWADHEWLCSNEPALAAVYSWARRLRGPEGLSSGQYGFMDCVGVSGNNLFMSLLFVEGARAMAAALSAADCSSTAGGRELTVPIANYTAEAQRTSDAIGLLFDPSVGMYRATDQGDNQTDVWGSVFSVALGAGSAAHQQAVVEYVTDNYEIIFAWGQVRHLPYPQTWQYASTWNRTGNNNLPGNFQNGGYWVSNTSGLPPPPSPPNRLFPCVAPSPSEFRPCLSLMLYLSVAGPAGLVGAADRREEEPGAGDEATEGLPR